MAVQDKRINFLMDNQLLSIETILMFPALYTYLQKLCPRLRFL